MLYFSYLTKNLPSKSWLSPQSMDQKSSIEETLNKIFIVINKYKWLIDLYVLDFFVDDHWEALPLVWQESLDNVDPSVIGQLISEKNTEYVFPLSLLALVKTVKCLSLPRRSPEHILSQDIKDPKHIKLNNLLLKHVKLKKRHEIDVMAKVVNKVSLETGCRVAVDLGSGLGHLMRVLTYKYGLQTAGIEGQTPLTEEARKLDLELEYTLKKQASVEPPVSQRPVHLNLILSSSEAVPLPYHLGPHGLVGLHPCGDLGPTLLRHFVGSDQARFLCLVGCCYMKLSEGYPMSGFVKGLPKHQLSYVGREIACHALDTYVDRLLRGDYHDLKVHAYRAALERALVWRAPHRRHSQVRSVRHTHHMTFRRYCELALHRLSVDVCEEALEMAEQDVSQWRRVLVVYSLRLLLAPLLETAILLDRTLYLLEQGIRCEIRAVFDPKVSPRNHVIIARK